MGWVRGTAGEITAPVRDAGAPASRDWMPPGDIALDVRNTFDTCPYRERNVIADLPGGALKEEVILCRTHVTSSHRS